MKKLSTAILSAAIVSAEIMSIIASPANAEPIVLEKLVVKGDDKSGLQLNKTTSTGSRLQLTALETPASVETLDSDTIKKRGDSNFREAISRTTAISDIGNLGSGASYSARGFTSNNSVGQSEDGVRLLTAASTLTYPSDTWGYKSVEILRGAASVLSGDGTVGGIINSVRKQPSQKSSLEAIVTGGSQDKFRVGIGGSGAVGKTGAYRIDAVTSGGAGHVDRGDYSNRSLLTAVEFKPAEKLIINLTLDHAEDSPIRYTGIPLRDGKFDKDLIDENYNIDNAIQEFIDDRFRHKITWDIADTSRLMNITYASNADRHWRNVEYFTFASANTIDRFGYTEIKHKQKQLGNRLEFSQTGVLFDLNNRWVVGHEIATVKFRYFDNFYDGNDPVTNIPQTDFEPGEFITIDPTIEDFRSATHQQAIFFENALDLTEKIKWVIGARQDDIKVDHQSRITSVEFDKNYSPFSHRLGLVYQSNPRTSFYGQWSQGSDPVTSLVSIRPGNSAFDLTSAQQSEVGIKHLLHQGKGEITFAVYDIVKDDIITRDPVNPQLRVQGGQQSSRGLEFSATLLPADNWRFDINVAVLEAKYDELIESGGISRAGKIPIDVPEKLANAWVYYDYQDWQFALGARYVGKRYVNNANSVTMDAYTIIDSTIAWHYSKQTTLRFNLRNIADEIYVPVSYDTEQVIIGESRRIELSAEIKF